MRNTSVKVATQPENSQIRVCMVEWCEKPSPKGRFCPSCYVRWLGADLEIPEGQTRCNGRDCNELVSKRPNGRSGLCPKCDSLRLIVGAGRALEDYGDPPQAPADKLCEAERHFENGEYTRALGAARRFFAVMAEHQVEEALGIFIEDDDLGSESRKLFDEMLGHYQHDEYFEAKEVLDVFNDVFPLENDLNRIDRDSLGSYAQEAYDDARRALVSGNLIEVRSSIETMESIESRVAEMEESKRQSFERSSGSNRKTHKRQRRDYDSDWRRRIGVEDEEAVTTVP